MDHWLSIIDHKNLGMIRILNPGNHPKNLHWTQSTLHRTLLYHIAIYKSGYGMCLWNITSVIDIILVPLDVLFVAHHNHVTDGKRSVAPQCSGYQQELVTRPMVRNLVFYLGLKNKIFSEHLNCKPAGTHHWLGLNCGPDLAHIWHLYWLIEVKMVDWDPRF